MEDNKGEKMQQDMTNWRKLSKGVGYGFQKMETARKARYKCLAQYVGRFYSKNRSGDGEERKASPINLLYNAVTTLIPNLVFKNPRVEITSQVMAYRAYGNQLGLCTDHLIRKIKLKQTLRKVITDALFLAGFMKTGLCDSGEYLELDGSPHAIGRPYADRVDPDDMVIDPFARDWEEMNFVGNRFRVEKQTLLASGLYDPAQVQKLISRYDSGTKFKQEAASLSGDPNLYIGAQEIAEYVDLVEVYLPQSNLLVTLPWNGVELGAEDPLRIVEYEGPENGPYHMLGFAYVPDNVLPVAPAGIWYDLHILANRLARKISRQAERMKTILAYEGSAADDAQEIADSDDGETVRVDNVAAVKEVSFGGTTDIAYKHMEFLESHFSKQAGNIDLLGGEGADAPTATQSQMLQANTSVRVSDGQDLVYDFTAEVTTDLAAMLHEDPLMNQPLVQRVNGVDQQVHFTPEMRAGDFMDYMLRVKPYSMARQDPNQELQRILQFASSVLPAMAQTFQLLGPAFNIEGAMNVVAQKMGIEEVDQIINSQMLQQRMAMMMQMIPPDGQLGAQMAPPAPPAGAGAGPMPGGGRPQQPNPRQMGPDGGISNQTLQNQAVQQGANQQPQF